MSGRHHTAPPEPFNAFPPGLAAYLRPFLDEIAADVVREIQRGIPQYSRPADDTYVRTLRTGVEQALSLFLDRMSKPISTWEKIAATYYGIGRGEADEDRSLDAFQQALRLGARVAWRRISTITDEDVLSRATLATLGEAMLVHLDEIAEATAVGYADARLRSAGELQRRRERLVELLITEPAPSAEAISDLAEAARWTVPHSLAVVLVDGTDEEQPITSPEILVRAEHLPICMVVPDPDGPGRSRAIGLILRGRKAVVGPTVSVTEGGRSARWAADALALRRRGILPDKGVMRCADHLSTLLLFHDEALVTALADHHLAPLKRVRQPHRQRLEKTLLYWLRCGHSASEVASQLGIHPQTVRYRLRQLDELFGSRLHDRDAQFEMELVLRVRDLHGTAPKLTLAPQKISC